MEENPKSKRPEPDDPMTLHANEVGGDPWVMLDCLIEEYARMGLGPEEVEKLFSTPFYQAPYALRETLGRDAIRERIERVFPRVGVFRVSVIHTDPAGVPPSERAQETIRYGTRSEDGTRGKLPPVGGGQ
jgi:hypothetical protein